MDFQSISEDKYFGINEFLLEIEVALKKANHSKNKELAEFAGEILRKITESRGKGWPQKH